MMILKSLIQNSTHQRYSKLHRKPFNLKEPLEMVTTGFWAFHCCYKAYLITPNGL